MNINIWGFRQRQYNNLLFVILIITLVFDPSDQVLGGAKPALLLLLILQTIFNVATTKGYDMKLPKTLFFYLFFFAVFLPVMALGIPIIHNPYTISLESINEIKASVFLLVIFYLAKINKVDLLKILCPILTIMASIILLIYLFVGTEIIDITSLYSFIDIGLFGIGARTYGSIVFPTIFFPTSPLFVLSMAQYTFDSLHLKGSARHKYLFLLFLNCAGMLLAGTRNNILFAFITPLLVYLWCAPGGKKARFLYVLCFLSSLLIVDIINQGILADMFSPKDLSNQTKLGMIDDYLNEWDKPLNVILGEGIGSSFFTANRGEVFLTELTYLEILRKYGLFMGAFYIGLLVVPLLPLLNFLYRDVHYVLIAYLSYLVISASNPFLVSSTGMLVLAIALQNSWKLFIKE